MARLFCRFLCWLSGWKVKPTFPEAAYRSVMVAAPHTSNWDAYYLKLAAVILGVPMRVAIKDNWTKGLIGVITRPLGALGIDRSPKEGSERLSQVSSMAELFKKHEKLSLVIAPEGTRRYRDRWKMGFYWVAQEAKVPIVLGFLDYENKIAGIGDVVIPVGTGQEESMVILNDFYRDVRGKFPEKFVLDSRFEQ